jgi:hypothetical protein
MVEIETANVTGGWIRGRGRASSLGGRGPGRPGSVQAVIAEPGVQRLVIHPEAPGGFRLVPTGRVKSFFPVKAVMALITPAVLFTPPDSGPETALGGGPPALAGYPASPATPWRSSPPADRLASPDPLPLGRLGRLLEERNLVPCVGGLHKPHPHGQHARLDPLAQDTPVGAGTLAHRVDQPPQHVVGLRDRRRRLPLLCPSFSGGRRGTPMASVRPLPPLPLTMEGQDSENRQQGQRVKGISGRPGRHGSQYSQAVSSVRSSSDLRSGS